MKPINNTLFETEDPDMLQIRKGGGCLTLFGLPFFIAGLFVLQIPFGLIPMRMEGGPLVFYLIFPLGLAFTGVGAALAFGRNGVIIDRRRQTILKWWGLIIPFKKTEYPLGVFENVRMEFHEGDSDSSDSYPISLVGSLHQPLPLFYPTNYRDARQAAEKLARFLGKPLEDTSTGTKIVKDSEYLDETFIEYLKRMKETVQLPPTPLRMRTIIEKTGNGIGLNIPGPQYGPARWFILIFPVILAGVVAFFFIRPLVLLPGPPAIRYGMACFAFIFFVFGPIVSTIRFLSRMSRQSTNIYVTKTAFSAGEMAGRKRTVSEIPFTELEDLVLILDRKTVESIDIGGKPYRPDGRPLPRFVQFFMKYAKNSSIIARSNKTMITFGKGLPQEELVYLYQLIRQAISHS